MAPLSLQRLWRFCRGRRRKLEAAAKLLVASEIGTAQTGSTFGCGRGCRVGDSRVTNPGVSRSPLERGAIERDSRVGENAPDSKPIPEYRGARETLRESTGTIP